MIFTNFTIQTSLKRAVAWPAAGLHVLFHLAEMDQHLHDVVDLLDARLVQSASISLRKNVESLEITKCMLGFDSVKCVDAVVGCLRPGSAASFWLLVGWHHVKLLFQDPAVVSLVSERFFEVKQPWGSMIFPKGAICSCTRMRATWWNKKLPILSSTP